MPSIRFPSCRPSWNYYCSIDAVAQDTFWVFADLPACFCEQFKAGWKLEKNMKRGIQFPLFLAMLVTLANTSCSDKGEDYVRSGYAKWAKGDLDGAIADYTKGIELKPDDAQAYYFRGDAKRVKGDSDGAIPDFTKAIQLNPNYAFAYGNRGTAKQAKGDWDGAIADYTKAIQLNPKDSWSYHNRGCLRYEARDFTNALVDFRKELEFDSTNDYTRFRVWLIRARQGETEAATAELQKYLSGRASGKPDDWAAKVGHFLTGQLSEPEFLAAAKNADSKKEAGQLCEAYFYAGSKHLFAGDKAAATDYFEKCIATEQKDYFEYASAVAELKFLKGQK
jgi:lipoprotein NlpI